jgi:hypothetical protein
METGKGLNRRNIECGNFKSGEGESKGKDL